MLNYIAIGLHFAFLRKQSSRTQTELAALVNVTHQAVSKWERGESLPDIETLVALSRLYGCKIDDLIAAGMDDEDDRTAQSKQIEENLPNDMRDASEIWRKALELISSQLSFPSYNTWFANTRAIWEEDTFVVISPTAFSTDWLAQRYGKFITATVCGIMQTSNLQFAFRPADKSNVSNEARAAAPSQLKQSCRPDGFLPFCRRME